MPDNKRPILPKIINIDGIYKLPDAVNELASSARFDFIYKSATWLGGSGGESRSGSGSTVKNTELYVNQLSQYLDAFKELNNNKPPVFFDAPCGDLNWIKDLFSSVEYAGGDISETLIADLNQQLPQIDTYLFDITRDDFPAADIWHCRHCHFHLSLSDIANSFEGFCRSKIDVALMTTHFLPDNVTFDIPSGSFRPLDLTNFPFYLPEPQLWLLDSQLLSGKTAMATGVWNKSQIKVGLENYRRLMHT